MKLNMIVAAALLATGASAFAADVNEHTLSGKDGFSIGSTTLTGSFSDTWDFKLTSNESVKYLITNALGDGEISGLTATLTGPTGTFAGTYGQAFGYQGVIDSFKSLGAGSYVLTISGVGSGSYYGGTLNVAPAVPEPASVALLLAGLGLVGVAAKRRKQA